MQRYQKIARSTEKENAFMFPYSLFLLLSCEMSQIQDKITQVYPLLLREIPSVPDDEISDSRLMANLASYVVDLFEAGRTEEVCPAFELAEHLITTGSEAEKHAAEVGFLETIQNVASHRKCGARAFDQFLGPMSKRAWLGFAALWRGKTSLAEVVASETDAKLRGPWWKFWRRRRRRSPRELLNEVQNPELRKIIEQITRE